MTQEEKYLLLKDLSARLPYSPKVEIDSSYTNAREVMPLNHSMLQDVVIRNFDVIPYLRPMSSMTEEEREDFWWNVLDMDWREDLDDDEEEETVPFPFVENSCGFYLDNFYLQNSFAVIDWLNEHHFDYRGLIEKGLAIEVTPDNNPYKNENN